MLPLQVGKGTGAMGRLEEAPPGFQGHRARGSSSAHNAQPGKSWSIRLSCAQCGEGWSWRPSVPGAAFAAGAAGRLEGKSNSSLD